MNKDKKPFEFSWEYDGFMVRTTHSPLTGNPYVELVKTYESAEGRKSCYTLAYWHLSSEGWDLRFVGDRMLELSQLHIEKVWPQLCAAQIALQGWFLCEEEERE